MDWPTAVVICVTAICATVLGVFYLLKRYMDE